MGVSFLGQMYASMLEQKGVSTLEQMGAFISCPIYSPNGAEAWVAPVKRRKERRPGIKESNPILCRGDPKGHTSTTCA